MPVACPICSTAARFMAAHPEADIYRCESCTHAFSDLASMPKQANYDSDYYDKVHRRWFEHPNVVLFERLVAIIPVGASVLDVGCGRGDFLRHVRSRRPDTRLVGIDQCPNSDPDIEFLQGDALSLDIHDRFDVVVSLAVIEHVADCALFADRIRELTKPGGVAVVMTLNESSLLYGLARAGKSVGIPLAFDRLYSSHHLHHFTRRSLRRLLESCGLIVSRQIMHDSPVKAVDLPVNGRAADALLRAALGITFGAGRIVSHTSLQTVICSR
jgi:2-polyprenyl-3-methyl-5-hydroxy-6-metoxy-1,4-benzoquinol methylase